MPPPIPKKNNQPDPDYEVIEFGQQYSNAAPIPIKIQGVIINYNFSSKFLLQLIFLFLKVNHVQMVLNANCVVPYLQLLNVSNVNNIYFVLLVMICFIVIPKGRLI